VFALLAGRGRPSERNTIMSKRKPSSHIPPEVLAQADAAHEEQEAAKQAQIPANRERSELATRLSAAVRELEHVLDPKKAYKSLMEACQGLAQAGRLAEWEQLTVEETWSVWSKSFRENNRLEMTRPPFDWARQLFDRACSGQLQEAEIVQTWERPPLKPAFRWLRTFLCELSGEGVVLNRKRQFEGKPLETVALVELAVRQVGPAALPKATRDSSQLPPDAISLSFRPGHFTLHTPGGDVLMPLSSKPWSVLQFLASALQGIRTAKELIDEIWPDSYATDQQVKDAVTDIRHAIRKAYRKAGLGELDFDPVLCVAKSPALAYQLKIPARE
jgi:hypothetical protein